MPGNDSAGSRTLAFTLAVVVVASAVTAVPGLVLFVQPAAANSHAAVAVAQGTSCYQVTPISGSQDVIDFYDYRNPSNFDNGNPDSPTFSSFGTTDYQENLVSSTFFYDGPNGLSLVVVHDDLGDEQGGSTVTWNLSGLPADGEWAVQDDTYTGRDDDFDTGETTASIDWKWGRNRTDGAVYRGLDAGGSEPITIDPAYNEEAQAWGEWPQSAEEEHRMRAWRLKDPGGGAVADLALDRRAFVHAGPCGVETAPAAALDGPNATEPNATVEFDASGTTDADGDVAGYEWDVDADPDVDAVTTGPTFTTSYDTAGERTVRVTAFDTYGNAGNATLTVEVTAPNEAPTASLTAPANVTANESVTLDASNSTDDAGITEYRWDVDGDGSVDNTTTEPTFTTSFATTGERTVGVTVVDATNATATATTTVSVTDPTELEAAITASATEVEPGETVTFDGSGSAPIDGILEYAWDFGDGANDTGATVEHAYDEPGTYTVTLTVNGSDDATATATTEVTVAEPTNGGGGGGGGAPPGGNGGSDDDDSDGSNPPSSPPASGGSTGAVGSGQTGTETPAPDPQPRFELGRLNASATDLLAGDEATFSTTVRNVGNGSGTKTVEFEVADAELANETRTLAPGENATVSFTHRFTEPGNYTVELDTSLETTVRVRAPQPDLTVSDVSASSDAVSPNEPLRLNATVRNDGRVAGSMELELRLFGEVVDVRNVSVPPGETRTVSFTRRVSAPGTYTAAVGGRSVTVTVRDANAGTTTTAADGTTATTTPGFTALVALVALLAAAAAAVRRRGR